MRRFEHQHTRGGVSGFERRRFYLGTVLISFERKTSFSVVRGPVQLHQQRPLIRIHFPHLFHERKIVALVRSKLGLVAERFKPEETERVASVGAADLCRRGFRTGRTSPTAFSCRA